MPSHDLTPDDPRLSRALAALVQLLPPVDRELPRRRPAAPLTGPDQPAEEPTGP
ncbi:MAG TPA: hypothetical protein VKP11_10715 [Frankiaceae bacterium]|nr:hypothetical protein [Frankiaceae bacterium]